MAKTNRSSSSSDAGENISIVSKRKVFLTGDDLDLWEMYYYAGVSVDPKVFKVLLDLVRLNIHPKAIVDMLSEISPNSKDFPKIIKQEKTPTSSQSSIESTSKKPVKKISTSSSGTASSTKRTSSTTKRTLPKKT